MKRNNRKTTAKTASSRHVAQVPQPHGGALNTAGTPGNKGGTGRPPNELVAMSRDVYAAYLEWAMQKITDPDAPDDVKQRIGNTTARIAVPARLELASNGLTLEELLAKSRQGG